MAVFEIFARERRELMVSDMARFLDIADSSCSDLLHTLMKEGYLMRTAKTRRFYPTGRLYAAVKQIAINDPLFRVGTEVVELLSEKTGESAFFGKLEDGAIKVLATVEGTHPLRYVLQVGERIALHASALGKAVLGSLDPDEMKRQMRLKVMRRAARKTILDLQELQENIDAQRARGWFSVDEEGSDGVYSIAIPMFFLGDPVAASIAGPLERMKANQEDYVKIMRQIAATVGNES